MNHSYLIVIITDRKNDFPLSLSGGKAGSCLMGLLLSW
jgi:hypothetical protein